MSKSTVEVSGRTIEISNPDKELYPDDNVTKADIADYFRAVADTMVPHLHGKPLAMRRFPDGIGSEGFYQKAVGDYFPSWIHTISVPLRSGEAPVEHVVCDDAATLIYLANQACLEFHTWLSPADALEYPDRLVIDLDPPDQIDLGELRATARRGFHVVAPLNGEDDYDVVRPFARELAEQLARHEPDRLTTEQRKDKRGERIFLDTNRNAYGQTAVTPYSLRARPGAPVATPIDWEELAAPRPPATRSPTYRIALPTRTIPGTTWPGTPAPPGRPAPTSPAPPEPEPRAGAASHM